jgi:DNA-directed RNA polymerase subunit RPC12/RpoP
MTDPEARNKYSIPPLANTGHTLFKASFQSCISNLKIRNRLWNEFICQHCKFSVFIKERQKECADYD